MRGQNRDAPAIFSNKQTAFFSVMNRFQGSFLCHQKSDKKKETVTSKNA